MPPKEDPSAEIIAILREEIAANRIDKSDFCLKISRRALGKIKRRLEKMDNPSTLEATA